MSAAAVRLPVQWATYPGDCTSILTETLTVPVAADPAHPFGIELGDFGNAKGPNTLDEMLHPVTAEYDPETKTTRVGFSYIAPPVSA